MPSYATAILFDVDGTLVDSVYAHVLAWDEVLHERGFDVPLWRIHRAVGMGGDRLVPWLLGHREGAAKEMATEEEEAFLARAGRLRPTVGSRQLIEDLEARDVPFILASSSTGRVSEALLTALGLPDLPIVTGDDVSTTKPSPDLLMTAASKIGADPAAATLVGDTPWDVEAAGRLGMRTMALRCGGFPDEVLLAAGAYAVVDDPGALMGRL